ncbi:glutamine amidotransferase [Brucepastera parasyntrophica]|uniref:type 1 glutamine amidotransferase family protein n=1 Tax=Brucepastera parasyntrophica TaxID=2880008 RepID=UPI00210D6E07|nr:type 1 glutamine amidotransferase family protein [Brucepastera parasyntrophica]ULQ58633.1 glutamine amidotransferase [Brucepastera parasyntrophica]
MTVFLYVLDTLADWEISFLTAEINSGRYLKKNITKPKTIKVGNSLTPIKTMGGIEITPDIDITDMALQNEDLIILPGADTWQSENNQKIIDIVYESLNKNIIVAAICGATFALAQKGILDTKKHTSNDKDYLKMICKNYKGEIFYENKPAVADNNLITASGIAPLEFTYEVIKKINIMENNTLEAWYNLYKTKEPKYFLS